MCWDYTKLFIAEFDALENLKIVTAGISGSDSMFTPNLNNSLILLAFL